MLAVVHLWKRQNEDIKFLFYLYILNTTLHSQVSCTMYFSSPSSDRLYPCGRVGARQACRAVTCRKGAVWTHVGEPHEGVRDHGDIVGSHQRDVVRGAALGK